MTAPIQWQKSSFSGAHTEQCVEVAAQGGGVLIRESDDPDAAIATSPARLEALLRCVKAQAREFHRFSGPA